MKLHLPDQMRILVCAFVALFTPVLLDMVVTTELETSILESTMAWSFCRFTKTLTCNKNTKDSQLYLEACELQCGAGEQIMCRDNPDLGMVHFCFPKEQCPDGYFRNMIMDVFARTITARYEPCPRHFYKPPTDCYEQCIPCITRYPIPEDIVVYIEGNTCSPALVYCNYNKGFFNDKNVTAINITDYYDGFCENIKNLPNHPCISGLVLLPNGTCVEHCPDSYDRDDSDLKFACKPLKMDSEHGELSTVQINTTTGQTPVPDIYTNANTQSNDHLYPVVIVILKTVIGVLSVIFVGVIGMTVLKKKGPTVINYIKGNYYKIKKSADIHINEAASKDTNDVRDRTQSEQSDLADDTGYKCPVHEDGGGEDLQQVVSEDQTHQTRRKLMV